MEAAQWDHGFCYHLMIAINFSKNSSLFGGLLFRVGQPTVRSVNVIIQLMPSVSLGPKAVLKLTLILM